jgi:hypothetical protein
MQSVGVAEVLLFFQGEHAPGVTRTPDLRIRNPFLYPAELRAQILVNTTLMPRMLASTEPLG